MTASRRSNGSGFFSLGVPAGLIELRRNFPIIVQWEQRICDHSVAQSRWSTTPHFPFVEHHSRAPREFGFVAFRTVDGRRLVIEPLYPDPKPPKDTMPMIELPAAVRASGRFTKAGYIAVLIEHTHPTAYGFDNSYRSTYVRGPSDKDFRLLARNPAAIGVVQALDAAGGRQFFYLVPTGEAMIVMKAPRLRSTLLVLCILLGTWQSWYFAQASMGMGPILLTPFAALVCRVLSLAAIVVGLASVVLLWLRSAAAAAALRIAATMLVIGELDLLRQAVQWMLDDGRSPAWFLFQVAGWGAWLGLLYFTPLGRTERPVRAPR